MLATLEGDIPFEFRDIGTEIEPEYRKIDGNVKCQLCGVRWGVHRIPLKRQSQSLYQTHYEFSGDLEKQYLHICHSCGETLGRFVMAKTSWRKSLSGDELDLLGKRRFSFKRAFKPLTKIVKQATNQVVTLAKNPEVQNALIAAGGASMGMPPQQSLAMANMVRSVTGGGGGTEEAAAAIMSDPTVQQFTQAVTEQGNKLTSQIASNIQQGVPIENIQNMIMDKASSINSDIIQPAISKTRTESTDDMFENRGAIVPEEKTEKEIQVENIVEAQKKSNADLINSININSRAFPYYKQGVLK